MGQHTKKGPYSFLVCSSSNAHVQPPIWAPDMRCFAWGFLKVSTTCLWTAKALARLRLCAGSPELVLIAYVISALFSTCWLVYCWPYFQNKAMFPFCTTLIVQLNISAKICQPLILQDQYEMTPSNTKQITEQKTKITEQKTICNIQWKKTNCVMKTRAQLFKANDVVS